MLLAHRVAPVILQQYVVFFFPSSNAFTPAVARRDEDLRCRHCCLARSLSGTRKLNNQRSLCLLGNLAKCHIPLLRGVRENKEKLTGAKLDKARRKLYECSAGPCLAQAVFACQVQCALAFQHQDAIETRKDTIPVTFALLWPVNSPLNARMSNSSAYEFALLFSCRQGPGRASWRCLSACLLRAERASEACASFPSHLAQSDYHDQQPQVY